jgi:hypothetical protein
METTCLNKTEYLVPFAKYIWNNQVKGDKLDRVCSMNRARRNACRILVGKPEEKRPLGRPRCRWMDNIKMDFREVG